MIQSLVLLLSCLALNWGQHGQVAEAKVHQNISDSALYRVKPIRIPAQYRSNRMSGAGDSHHSTPQPQIETFKLRKMESRYYSPYQFQTLKTEDFRNLHDLEELTLIGDPKQPTLQIGEALSSLNHLKSLNISHFNVQHLTKNHFRGLSSLTKLTLNSCNIGKVDSNAFEDLTKLVEVDLSHNGISKIPPKTFGKLSKLEKLVLVQNGIKDLAWNEFEGLSSLKELVLGDNQVSFVDVDRIVKFLPNLRSLGIWKNPVGCTRNDVLMKEISSKMHHSVKIGCF